MLWLERSNGDFGELQSCLNDKCTPAECTYNTLDIT